MDTKQKSIGILVGSLRRDSYTKAIANIFSTLFGDDFRVETVEIGHLPMFNQDFDDDGNTPESYTEFRNKIKELDGFMFFTPEYNRSIPAVIKNALDIASRPYGQNVWNDKPGAIISVSPGKLSAFGANHHLRQVMCFLNVHLMSQPEVYLGNVDTMLDDKGQLVDEGTMKFFESIVKAFEDWVTRLT